VIANLAGRYGQQPVSVRVLAEREDVSYQFACKILQQLHRARLVRSEMGPKGGFVLNRPPSEINLLKVITAIQGPVKFNKCEDDVDACPRRPGCPVGERLTELEAYIESYLGSITLEQLLKGNGKNLNERKKG
jgi:Rrf2 family protein